MSSKERPLLRETLPDQGVFVANEKTFTIGCLCTAEIELFAYEGYGVKGIGAHMLSVTKLADPELTEEQILAIRIEYIPRSLGTPKGVGGRGVKGYLQGSIRFLAEKYKVSRWEIKTIVQNKSWKHL